MMEAGILTILQVCSAYKPAYRMGGPILSISATAEELTARGHKVVVFTTNCHLDRDLDVPLNQPVMVDGVEVWYFKRYEPLKQLFPFISYLSQSVGFLYSPSFAREIKRQVYRFDLIHAHNPFVYPSLISAKVAINANKPLLFNMRGAFDPERIKFREIKKRLYISLVLKTLLCRSAALIALTEAEYKSYQLLHLNAPCKIIPNWVDTTKYVQDYDEETIYPFGIRKDHLVILFLGRLHPMKGVDLLLDAFLQTASQTSNAVLIMAGPDEGGLEKQYRQELCNSEFADRVIFPGMVSGNIKLNLLARADLFCLPSIAEGFSMAVLEAMASATAVMISPACHFEEVEIWEAGIVVERKISKWADKLSVMLSNAPQLRRMGRNALNLVKQRYSVEKVVSKLEQTYKEAIVDER